MRKRAAIKIFGARQADLARAVGVTRQAVAKWPEELTPEQQDRVVGAAVRLGLWPDRVREVAEECHAKKLNP